MNVGRGLVRLWLVATVIWASLVWLLFHNLPGHPLFPAVERWATAEEAFDRLAQNQSGRVVVRPASGPMIEPWMVGAAVPPVTFFAVGAGLLWVVRGFRILIADD